MERLVYVDLLLVVLVSRIKVRAFYLNTVASSLKIQETGAVLSDQKGLPLQRCRNLCLMPYSRGGCRQQRHS